MIQRSKTGSLIWLYNIQRDLKFKNFNCVFWKVCSFIKLNGVGVIHYFSWICNLTKPNTFSKIKPPIWYSLRNNYTEYSSMLLLLSRFSRVLLCATPETAAHQAPLSLGFSRQEHWSGLPFQSSVSSRLIHLFARAKRGKKIKYCLGCYDILSRFSLKRICSMLRMWNSPWKDLDH